MKAPQNRRVFVVGCGAATPLGMGFDQTWQRAVRGESGLRLLTRCTVDFPAVVGEIPDWDPAKCSFATPKEVANWNAAFVLLTMEVCKQALEDAHLEMDGDTGPRTMCLVGSAINGTDAYREAMIALQQSGPNRVSPFLLPNVCANVPAGKAGALLGFTGPIFSPQGACASGNHAIAMGARMLRDGDSDFALVGGAEMPLVPEIVHGFANMNATFKLRPSDRAQGAPAKGSRPFSSDRRGFVLAEGAAIIVLASEDAVRAHGLDARAEVLGVGFTSDACHFTRPNKPTIVRAIREALDDAGVDAGAVGNLNAHGTSTLAGDTVEVECLRDVFGAGLPRLPISANKSQIGHSLGAAAAIEAALAVEGLRRQIMLPTLNYLPDPSFGDLDVVCEARHASHEIVLSNAFGFGGTNCCLVLRGV
jgi:3-oxoacyl-[acyl-carrier-protein] synthase II